MGRQTSNLERIPHNILYMYSGHTLRADGRPYFQTWRVPLVCVFWYKSTCWNVCAEIIPLGLLQLYGIPGCIVWTNVWPSQEGIPQTKAFADCAYSISLLIQTYLLYMFFLCLPDEPCAKGARHISILSLVLPALLGCVARSHLRPVQQNASRMPAVVRIRTERCWICWIWMDLVPKLRPRCSTNNGSMMTTGISDHQRQEDDFAKWQEMGNLWQQVRPRKHIEDRPNIWKQYLEKCWNMLKCLLKKDEKRMSLQMSLRPQLSHLASILSGITDVEFFPRPASRKQATTQYDTQCMTCSMQYRIHRHRNAIWRSKAEKPSARSAARQRAL